jgi:uncharacterized small protein (DUF1192 family)
MFPSIQSLSKTLAFLGVEILRLSASKKCQLLLVLTLITPYLAQASQLGIVMPEKAYIYADPDRTSPIGFVRRGKKLKLSSIAKNKGSVYATVVSGKLAYIGVTDVNTEIEDLESERLVAERFQKVATKTSTSSYSFGAFQYSSILSQENSSGPTKNKESVNWIGVGIKGEIILSPRWDLQILGQAMQAKNAELETWRVFSVGAAAGYRLIDLSKFQVRMLGEMQLIPFATYELVDAFRIKGYGVSVAGGLDSTIKFSTHWGLEIMALYQYIRLSGFEAPENQLYDAPSYIGLRLGANLTYIF